MTLKKNQKTGFGIGLFLLILGILIFLNTPFGGAGVLYDYKETIIPLGDGVVLYEGYAFTYDETKLQIYADGVPINDYEWNNNVKIITQTGSFADISVRVFKGGNGGVVAASEATPPVPFFTDTNKDVVTTVTKGSSIHLGAYVKWDTGMAGNPDISQVCSGYIVWRAINPDGNFFYKESNKISEIYRHGGKYENIYSPGYFKLSVVGKFRLWAAEGYDCRGTITTVDFDKIGYLTVTKPYTPTTTLPSGNGDTDPPSVSCTVKPKEITDGNVLVECTITDPSGVKVAWVEVNGRAVGGGLPLIDEERNKYQRTIFNKEFTKETNTLIVRAKDEAGWYNSKAESKVHTVTKTTPDEDDDEEEEDDDEIEDEEDDEEEEDEDEIEDEEDIPAVEICGNGLDDDGDGMIDAEDKDSTCYKEKTNYMKYLEDPTVAFILTLVGGIIVVGLLMKKGGKKT